MVVVRNRLSLMPAMSIKVDAIHPFFKLREQLAPLNFDVAKDTPASAQGALQEYLHFYQLNFPGSLARFHAMGTLQCGEYTIVAQYWVPAVSPKGTVFVLHGYYDHVGIFKYIIHYLLELGFAVVAYDQPGHGLSTGEQASINHFSEYVAVLQQCLKTAQGLPQPWHAIGQSTGGGVLLHALLQERITNPFQRVILLAPLLKPVGWDHGNWLYYLLKPFVRKIPRRYSNNSHDKTFVDFAHYEDPLQSRYLSVVWTGAMKEWLERFPFLKPINVPALLIQGDDDHTVNWRYNLPAIQEKIQGLHIVMIPGARHQLVNESEAFRQQVFATLRNYLLAS